MISFDFAYHRPDTLDEAAACHRALAAAVQSALYYGGGTEIISMARAQSVRFDAVIDIKRIPECSALCVEGGMLCIGSAVTLTQIAESGCFPLLCEAAARIADHTIQGKITLGGNLGGSIAYRECALPLMISGCRARVMTGAGLVERDFPQVFDGRLRLDPGEFLVQILVDQADIRLPYNHCKRTRTEKIGYPLISLAANSKDGAIRAAISGAGSAPMLLPCQTLNDASMPVDARIEGVLAQIDAMLIEDLQGGKAYRRFVLRNILSQMFANLGGA